MTEKVEFASPEWLAALKGMLPRYIKLAGPGVSLSICEVFTAVPAHLDKNGDGIIAWHCRINDGSLEFADGEIFDADLKTVADYQFIVPFARMQIEASSTGEYQTMQTEGERAGKVRHEGDRSKVPPAFYGMHNEIAELTI